MYTHCGRYALFRNLARCISRFLDFSFCGLRRRHLKLGLNRGSRVQRRQLCRQSTFLVLKSFSCFCTTTFTRLSGVVIRDVEAFALGARFVGGRVRVIVFHDCGVRLIDGEMLRSKATNYNGRFLSRERDIWRFRARLDLEFIN